MKKFFGVLVLLVFVLTGCLGEKPIGADEILLTGDVIINNTPVSGAEIIFSKTDNTRSLKPRNGSDLIAATDAKGKFRLVLPAAGVYEITVSQEGRVLLKLTRKLRLKRETLPIRFQSSLTVLHHSDISSPGFQVSCHVSPGSLAATGVEITSPTGLVENLEHNPLLNYEHYSTWWNTGVIVDGEWVMTLYPQGHEPLRQFFAVDSTRLPPRPTLYSPLNRAAINTTTPTLKFFASDLADRVTVRIYERDASSPLGVDRDSLQVFEAESLTEFKVPRGVLKEGKEYVWQVYIRRSGGISLSYDALSNRGGFRVIGN
ncbi:MAG TPA: DUF4198 domain-containing protein [Firmicutes bacterium]|nr:DUF4198 domain-containing protein [Bacillota bacterium]